MTTQILNFNDEELTKVAREIQEGNPVLFFEQDLTQSDYVKLMKRFGEPETPKLWMNPKDNPEIFIVTGKRYEDGSKVGMFGDKELGWHSNGNSRKDVKKILVALYCEKECEDTTLSIVNTRDVFRDLPEEEQEYLRGLYCLFKYKNNTMMHLEDDDPELEVMDSHVGTIRKLVDIHPHTGEEYIYFSYHFIQKVWHQAPGDRKRPIDRDQMVNTLRDKIFKSKYMTHHIFKKGDLILMDQFSSLHRRTAISDLDRELWRIAADYSTIMPHEFYKVAEDNKFDKKKQKAFKQKWNDRGAY